MLASIAAVVIGGTSVSGGRANIPGVWGGTLFLVLLLMMLNTFGVSAGVHTVRVLTDKRNERRHPCGVTGVRLAKLAVHEGLLDSQFAPEGEGDEHDGERSAPFPDRQRRSDEGEENTGVDRMADKGVGTLNDELVVALERDVRAPVARKQYPRPDGQGDAGQRQRRAEPHKPQAQGRKALVERSDGNLRRCEQIDGDEQRQVMREPQRDTFALRDRLAAARHPDPGCDKDEPQEGKEPKVEHWSAPGGRGVQPSNASTP